MKNVDKMIKNALVCTPTGIQYIEVFTTGANYVHTRLTSNKIPLKEARIIKGTDVLIHHLKNAPGYTMGGKTLRDYTDRVMLIELNILANDVNRVPTQIRLSWD